MFMHACMTYGLGVCVHEFVLVHCNYVMKTKKLFKVEVLLFNQMFMVYIVISSVLFIYYL